MVIFGVSDFDVGGLFFFDVKCDKVCKIFV